MGVEEKTMMMGKFLESIPVHQEKARQTSAGFAELVHDVEIFPEKVNRYLREAEAAEANGFWSKLWTGLKQCVFGTKTVDMSLIFILASVPHFGRQVHPRNP
jgi:hypothetical protein